MNPGEVWLGHKGNEIKLPPEGRQVKPGTIESVRGEEMASGRYVEDIRWRKKKWSITYEIMKGEFLENMVELYESQQFLNFMIADRNGIIDEYKVKMVLKKPVRWKIIGPWFWKGGTIELRQVNPNA